MNTPIYLDNHATTRVDPRVVAAMLPYFEQVYGNAGSSTHSFGRDAREAVDHARERVARQLRVTAGEVYFTSGATESNNLALQGAAKRLAGRGRHLVTVVTEHPSVLDPLRRLAREGFELDVLPVIAAPDPRAGCLDPARLEAALRPETVLASVMWANNEIGAIHPLAEVAAICRRRKIVLHVDATQAIGRIPVRLDQVDADLVSFTAHKFYGPKGVGALVVRRRSPPLRLAPLVEGGGQESGLRSGTLNVPGIVGLATALELCNEELPRETGRLAGLRQRLWDGLRARIPGVTLNGPALDLPGVRLPGNLNAAFPGVEGEAILLATPDVALSAGSACSSESHEASHVLRSLGMDDIAARGSLRFGLGRFNTDEEVDFAVDRVAAAMGELGAILR